MAYGINTPGQIVGSMENSTTHAEHAFLYNNGQMTDLNTLISPTSGWTLQATSGNNDSGQIVGMGVDPNGHTEGFLLSPIPEPSMIALLGAAAVATGWRWCLACVGPEHGQDARATAMSPDCPATLVNNPFPAA